MPLSASHRRLIRRRCLAEVHSTPPVTKMKKKKPKRSSLSKSLSASNSPPPPNISPPTESSPSDSVTVDLPSPALDEVSVAQIGSQADVVAQLPQGIVDLTVPLGDSPPQKTVIVEQLADPS